MIAAIQPWTLLERVVCWEIWQSNMSRVIMRIDKPVRLDEQARTDAEAHLIAKAPELLLKGEALLAAAERHVFGDECLVEREAFRAVLQEARGQRPATANEHPSNQQEGQAHDR